MFKSYQIKWYFILTGILTLSSLLIHRGSLEQSSVADYLGYIFRLMTTVLVAWMIHGYFFVHGIKAINDYLKYFFSNLVAMLATVAIMKLFAEVLSHNNLIDIVPENNLVAYWITYNIRALCLSSICFVVFYSVHTNTVLQTTKIEKGKLEQAHLQAQLLSLQQQISPHFLFNSLSTLNSIANDHPTKNFVVQLAAVYRYVLNFNQHYLTELENELAFVKAYLYIMNQRFEDGLIVKITVPECYLKHLIPPLSLQMLIENAIKHNAMSFQKPLKISILADATPSLTVENNYQPKSQLEEGTGTGLKNISERYKLLAHLPIQVIQKQNKFSVVLPLLKK